jgi:hypothetical protein
MFAFWFPIYRKAHKMHNKPKILFVLKKKQTSHPGLKTISSGLLNSANFVNDMLVKNGFNSHIVEVKDNNDIDREVTKFKADIVIIEALWVVPSKFEVLTKLHPKVKWIVRLHSEVPFIANEGIAIEWVYEYQKFKNVFISVNSERAQEDFDGILKDKTIYLPNYYPVDLFKAGFKSNPYKATLEVGCFGAVRPLKNQLYQAVAAIQFADEKKRKLHFHINVARVENHGDPVLKNLRALFQNNPKHKLIEHTWLSHKEFLNLIKTLDLGLQVSFTETFNIVAADFVNSNVPVVVSDEIKWMTKFYKASPTDSCDIKSKMNFALNAKNFNVQYLNKVKLWKYCRESESIWTDFMHSQKHGSDCR